MTLLQKFVEIGGGSITMTVASASIETRVSYQLFQSSVISRSLAPVNEKHCVEKKYLAAKDGMLHFVAR
jgi:hypothetical protein